MTTLTLTFFENGSVIVPNATGHEMLATSPDYGSVTLVVGQREFIVAIGSFVARADVPVLKEAANDH